MTLTYHFNPANFKNLSNFQSKEDFNQNYEMILADHAKTFTKCELNFLRVYKRYAVKVVGVVTAKIKTVVTAAIEKYNLKTSVRTAKRALEKAQAIGLLTLHETRSSKTGLKAPSIAQFNKYQIGTTEQPIKSFNDGREATTENPKMAPHKTVLKKAIIINILNTNKAKVCKSVATLSKKLKVQKKKTFKLLTQSHKPLKFHSRLKDTLYKNNIQDKKERDEIIKLVYGNVYYNTKLPVWASHKEQMLEHALMIVEDVLSKRNDIKINSLKGFLNYRMKEELNAYMWLNGVRDAYQQMGLDIASYEIENFGCRI